VQIEKSGKVGTGPNWGERGIKPKPNLLFEIENATKVIYKDIFLLSKGK